MHSPSIIIPDTAICVAAENDVVEICKPLFEHTPIDYFYYGKYYKNNKKIISLSTHTGWCKFQFNNGLYAMPNEIAEGTFLASDFLPRSVSYAKEFFGRQNFIALIKEFDDCYEIFGFNSKQQNIASFYFNNFDVLLKFKLYFADQGKALIKTAEKQPIIIPQASAMVNNQENLTRLQSINKINKNLIDKALALKQYDFVSGNKTIKISPRELDCLAYLSHGRSAKETARMLNISSRTVETHLNNLRDKIGTVNKTQLIDFFESNDFSKIWIPYDN